jgi:hypothetical protein
MCYRRGSAFAGAHPHVQRVLLRRAGIPGKSRAIRRSAKQLPQRSPESAHRHPHQPGGRLSRGRPPGRTTGRWREFPGPLSAGSARR